MQVSVYSPAWMATLRLYAEASCIFHKVFPHAHLTILNGIKETNRVIGWTFNGDKKEYDLPEHIHEDEDEICAAIFPKVETFFSDSERRALAYPSLLEFFTKHFGTPNTHGRDFAVKALLWTNETCRILVKVLIYACFAASGILTNTPRKNKRLMDIPDCLLNASNELEMFKPGGQGFEDRKAALAEFDRVFRAHKTAIKRKISTDGDANEAAKKPRRVEGE